MVGRSNVQVWRSGVGESLLRGTVRVIVRRVDSPPSVAGRISALSSMVTATGRAA